MSCISATFAIKLLEFLLDKVFSYFFSTDDVCWLFTEILEMFSRSFSIQGVSKNDGKHWKIRSKVSIILD